MMDITLAIPVIVALVSAAKIAGLKSRFAPLLSVGLGMLLFFFFGDNTEVGTRVFMGILAGLGASGLYSGTKTTIKSV